MCFILKCEREICAFKVTDFFLLLHFTTNPCDRKGKKWNYILSAQEARIDRTAARWTPGPPPPLPFHLSAPGTQIPPVISPLPLVLWLCFPFPSLSSLSIHSSLSSSPFRLTGGGYKRDGWGSAGRHLSPTKLFACLTRCLLSHSHQERIHTCPELRLCQHEFARGMSWESLCLALFLSLGL